MTDNNYCACNGGDANYIIRLNQQGAPGEKGDKGDQGFSPVVNYIANDDVVQFTLVNEGNIQTTPNFYNYFASKSLDNIEYDNPFSVNGISLYEADSNTSFVLTGKDNLGLQANETIGMTVGTGGANSTVQVATGTTGVTISTGLGNIDLTSVGRININTNDGMYIDGTLLLKPLSNDTDELVSFRKNLLIQSDNTMGLQVSDSSNHINRVALNDLTDGTTTGVTIETKVGDIKLNSANIIDVKASDLISIYQGYSKQLYLGSSGGNVTMRGDNIAIGESSNQVTLNSSGLKYQGSKVLTESDITTMVTTDTAQTITGNKTFSGSTSFDGTNGITIGSNLKLTEDNSGEYIYTSTTSPIQISNSAHSIRIASNGVYADNYSILTVGNMANSVVTLSDDQIGNNAITGHKQFKTGNVYFTGGKTIIQNSDNSKNIATFGSDNDNLTITSQQTNSGIDLISNGTGKVMYNGNEVATKSDIPTSNDIEAHKAYLANGTILSDTTGYENVKSYKENSFDIHKFIINGSPNITGGVMDNITNSNYASLNQYYFSGSWKIELRAKCTRSTSLQYFLDIFDPSLASPNVSEIVVRRTQNSDNIVFYFFKTGQTALSLTITDDSNDYYIAIEYDDSTSKYKCTVNDTTSVFQYTNFPLNTSSYYSISFGARTYTGAGADALTTGSIDLSSISITGGMEFNPSKVGVDQYTFSGNTDYVNYTLSNTGSKIVTVSSGTERTLINKIYNTYGYAPYYTIDETNQNYTLPQGEIYGLMGIRTLRDSYRNGTSYYEVYSDRTLEQGGSCTSGTAVTFLKPFADTNYVLSVPYSAKTYTGFTPSQTGDWIAKGVGL